MCVCIGKRLLFGEKKVTFWKKCHFVWVSDLFWPRILERPSLYILRLTGILDVKKVIFLKESDLLEKKGDLFEKKMNF